MGHEVADQLARFAVQTKFEDMPKEAVEFAKCLTLKVAAGTISGSAHPTGKNMAGMIRDRRLPEEVGVTGSGFKTSLWEAVYLESFLSHTTELEDDRFDGGISWDITVIPLLVCLAEKLNLTGRALTEAIVVGLEVHSRTCSYSAAHRGIHIIPPAIGPAAAGARALGLNEEQTASAMGLALSGVPLSILNHGTDAHFFESAMHALQGIMAAEMAKNGMTSNPDIIKYLTDLLGADKVVPAKMTADLGKKWMFREISIKKYPCWAGAHRQIDVVIELMKMNNLTPEQVETIEVHVSPAEEAINRSQPKTPADLQFSLQHVLAVSMLEGDVNLDHFNDAAIANPKYREASKKVNMITHKDWNPVVWKEPARITIKTKDGRTLSRERQEEIGSPHEPLTVEQFRQLYVKFTRGVLPDKLVKKTADAILDLENLKDIQELRNALVFFK